MRERALVTEPLSECDLIAKGMVNGEQRGWVMLSDGRFISDRAAEGTVGLIELAQLALTPGQEMTFTCAPPNSGFRMGVDRDEDGVFDRDEIDSGGDPADSGSVP